MPSPDQVTDALAGVVARTRTLLLDFDGPVCTLGRPAASVAAEPRDRVGEHADAVRDDELSATETATATPGFDRLVDSIDSTGRQLVIVGNTSVEAITAYLRRIDLLAAVRLVVGRYDGMAPDLLMPSSHLIRLALIGTDALPLLTTFIGGSDPGIEAARTAYVASIGYADQPGAAETLTAAGVDALVSSLDELADGLIATPLRAERARRD